MCRVTSGINKDTFITASLYAHFHAGISSATSLRAAPSKRGDADEVSHALRCQKDPGEVQKGKETSITYCSYMMTAITLFPVS